MTSPIGSKSAIADFFRFIWYSVICLSSHLYEKNVFLSFHSCSPFSKQSGCFNKEQSPLFYFLINCISARSAPRLLSVKELWQEGRGGRKLLICEWSFFWKFFLYIYILSLKVKSKTVNFNPLIARVAIQQPNDKQTIIILKISSDVIMKFCKDGIFPEKFTWNSIVRVA